MVGGGGFLVFTPLAVVRAGQAIHHKDEVSFSLLAPTSVSQTKQAPKNAT